MSCEWGVGCTWDFPLLTVEDGGRHAREYAAMEKAAKEMFLRQTQQSFRESFADENQTLRRSVDVHKGSSRFFLQGVSSAACERYLLGQVKYLTLNGGTKEAFYAILPKGVYTARLSDKVGGTSSGSLSTNPDQVYNAMTRFFKGELYPCHHA